MVTKSFGEISLLFNPNSLKVIEHLLMPRASSLEKGQSALERVHGVQISPPIKNLFREFKTKTLIDVVWLLWLIPPKKSLYIIGITRMNVSLITLEYSRHSNLNELLDTIMEPWLTMFIIRRLHKLDEGILQSNSRRPYFFLTS